MRRSTFKATLANAIMAAEYYLQCKSLNQTGIHFGCDPRTIRYRLELLKIEEPSLYKKVIDLLTNQNSIENYKREMSKRVKAIKNNSFESLGKKVTRRKLIDWYATTQYNQKISVGELIKLAEGYGIQVIR